MAIITLAEAKAILQITGSDYDTLITALIPDVEGVFLNIRDIPFFEIEADITSGDATVTDITNDDMAKLDKDAYLEASGIAASSYILKVNSVLSNRVSITANNIEMSENATATTSSLLITVYPPGSKYASAKIIGYMIDLTSASGLSSENIGTYSWTRSDIKASLPKDITNLIKQYQSTY